MLLSLMSLLQAEPVAINYRVFIRPYFMSNPDFIAETSDASFSVQQSTRVAFLGKWGVGA